MNSFFADFDVHEERLRLLNSSIAYLTKRWVEIEMMLDTTSIDHATKEGLLKEQAAFKKAIDKLCEMISP